MALAKPKTAEGVYDLLLRDVPGDVMMALEVLAESEGRSAMAEARKLLAEAVRRKRRREA